MNLMIDQISLSNKLQIEVQKFIQKKLNDLEEKSIILPKNLIDKTKLEWSMKVLKIKILAELGEIKEKVRNVKC